MSSSRSSPGPNGTLLDFVLWIGVGPTDASATTDFFVCQKTSALDVPPETKPVSIRKKKPIMAPNRFTVAAQSNRPFRTFTWHAHAVTILDIDRPTGPRTNSIPLKFMPSMEFTPTTSTTFIAGTTVGTLMQWTSRR